MINLHKRLLPTSAGSNPRPPGLQSELGPKGFPCYIKSTCYLFLYNCTGELKTGWLVVLGFNDTSTTVGHFVSLPETGRREIEEIVEEEKGDRRDSRGDEKGPGEKEENE